MKVRKKGHNRYIKMQEGGLGMFHGTSRYKRGGGGMFGMLAKCTSANSLKLVFSSSYAGCFCLVCWFSCSFVSEACTCFGEWLQEVLHVETFVRVLRSSRVNLK